MDYKKRSHSELTFVSNPAWPALKDWISHATNPVEVLPPSDRRSSVLESFQVTVHSALGAIIYETGGLLIDHGWVRVLGSGHPRLPRTLFDWNLGRTTQGDGPPPPFLLVADDVVGGFYAIDGGGLGKTHGHVCYFAPDTLRWETLGKGYTDFIRWLLMGDVAKYYETMRWPGWKNEVASLGGDQALSIVPFLWTKEGKDVATCSRRPAPIKEIYDLNVIDLPRQLDSSSCPDPKAE